MHGWCILNVNPSYSNAATEGYHTYCLLQIRRLRLIPNKSLPKKKKKKKKKATTEKNAQKEGEKLKKLKEEKKKVGFFVFGLLKSKSLFLFGCSDKFVSPVC